MSARPVAKPSGKIAILRLKLQSSSSIGSDPMMKFQANLSRITINPKQLPVIDAYVKSQIEEAARVWLTAALEIVPAWSGASRATFQALADAVNFHVAIDLSASAPNRIGLGRLYSGGGIRRNGQGSYEFFYETSLRYLIANETRTVAPRTEGLRGRMLTPTPFEFREAGNRAVERFLQGLDLPLFPLVQTRI